jgi:hypothetical protein
MAAKAGAARVTASERVPWVAEAARAVVAHNGLGAVVTVVPKASEDVEVGADLPRRADVLVSEVVGNALVDEGVIGLVNDALERLVGEPAEAGGAGAGAGADGAGAPLWRVPPRVVPCLGRLVGVLVQAGTLRTPPPGSRPDVQPRFFGAACGFDFAPFNALISARGMGDDVRAGAECAAASFADEDFMWTKEELSADVVDAPDWRHKYLSAPVELCEFDWRGARPAPLPRRGAWERRVRVTATGEVHAVLVWLELQMDAAGAVWLTTCPNDLRAVRKLKGEGTFKARNWTVKSYPQRRALSVSHTGGDEVQLRGTYEDGKGLVLEVDVAGSTLGGAGAPAAGAKHKGSAWLE